MIHLGNLLISILFMLGSQALADWHYLDKVTKVTVRGDAVYVQGTNARGHTCVNESSFYGTLNHLSTEPGHKEYYSLALSAQAMGKGLACYVYNVRANGVCVMDNCYSY